MPGESLVLASGFSLSCYWFCWLICFIGFNWFYSLGCSLGFSSRASLSLSLPPQDPKNLMSRGCDPRAVPGALSLAGWISNQTHGREKRPRLRLFLHQFTFEPLFPDCGVQLQRGNFKVSCGLLFVLTRQETVAKTQFTNPPSVPFLFTLLPSPSFSPEIAREQSIDTIFLPFFMRPISSCLSFLCFDHLDLIATPFTSKPFFSHRHQ